MDVLKKSDPFLELQDIIKMNETLLNAGKSYGDMIIRFSKSLGLLVHIGTNKITRSLMGTDTTVLTSHRC